jgi:hypothetical protein
VDRRPVDPTGDISGLGRLVKEAIAATAAVNRHCERSEAIQILAQEEWIASSLCSSQ